MAKPDTDLSCPAALGRPGRVFKAGPFGLDKDKGPLQHCGGPRVKGKKGLTYRHVSPVRKSYAIIYRFVEVDVAVTDFDVEAALRVGTDPGFKMDGCTLASEVGEGNQVSQATLLTFRKYDRLH